MSDVFCGFWGSELRSPCLHSLCISNWGISPAPLSVPSETGSVPETLGTALALCLPGAHVPTLNFPCICGGIKLRSPVFAKQTVTPSSQLQIFTVSSTVHQPPRFSLTAGFLCWSCLSFTTLSLITSIDNSNSYATPGCPRYHTACLRIWSLLSIMSHQDIQLSYYHFSDCYPTKTEWDFPSEVTVT